MIGVDNMVYIIVDELISFDIYLKKSVVEPMNQLSFVLMLDMLLDNCV